MTNPRFEPESADERGAPGSADSYARGAESVDAPEGHTQDAPAPAADAASAELEAQRDKYLRLAAEYDNYRRRTLKERQEAGARAQAELVKQFLDALDDLARFAHVDPATVDAPTVVHGVELVERKLLKTLGAAGLEVLDPVDQTFDPALHEAVATEPAVASEDDHVVARVYQPGYRFGGQLLRPARVVVKQWNG